MLANRSSHQQARSDHPLSLHQLDWGLVDAGRRNHYSDEPELSAWARKPATLSRRVLEWWQRNWQSDFRTGDRTGTERFVLYRGRAERDRRSRNQLTGAGDSRKRG